MNTTKPMLGRKLLLRSCGIWATVQGESTISDAQTISVNPEQPTEFSSSYEVVLPAGTNLLDIQNWKRVTLPSNITSSVTVSAFVYLSGKTSLGRFDAFISMNFQGRVARFQQSGVVELYLS